MKNILQMALLFFSMVSVNAQEWEWAKRAGGDRTENIQSLAADSRGNVYATGLYNSANIRFGSFNLVNTTGRDRYVVKYDSDGNVLWAKNISGSSSHNGRSSIAVDEKGNVFVASDFTSQTIVFDTVSLTLSNRTGSDAYIVKYNKEGTVLWAKNTKGSGNDLMVAAGLDRDGNLYATGQFGSPVIDFGGISLNSAGRFSLYLVKYDNDGTPLWAKKAGNDNLLDYVLNMAVDSDGNSHILGNLSNDRLVFDNVVLNHSGTSGDLNPFLVKYDSDGNALWVRAGVSDSSLTRAVDVAVDSEGNAVVVGSYYSETIVFSGQTLTNTYRNRADLFAVKYDGQGSVLWLRGAGGTDADTPSAVSIDSGDNIYVGGSFRSFSLDFGGNIDLEGDGWTDNFIVKYSSSGTPLWVKSASGPRNKYMDKIVSVPSGDLYGAGRFSQDIRFGNAGVLNSAGQDDFFLVKVKDPPLSVEKPAYESVGIYPNPAKEIININMRTGESESEAYFITDMTGRKVKEGRIEGLNAQINVGSLPEGFYMLHIQGQKTKSGKFIKN